MPVAPVLTPQQRQQVNALLNSNARVNVNLPVRQLANIVYYMVTMRRNPMLPAIMDAFMTQIAGQALTILETLSPGISAIVAIVEQQYSDEQTP